MPTVSNSKSRVQSCSFKWTCVPLHHLSFKNTTSPLPLFLPLSATLHSARTGLNPSRETTESSECPFNHILVKHKRLQSWYILLCQYGHFLGLVGDGADITHNHGWQTWSILSDVHTISVTFCFTQIYCLHSYLTIEFYNLTAMSYDRYVSICHPLQYHQLMTAKITVYLIATLWVFSFLGICVTTSLSFSLQLCSNFINKVYCNNYSIVKLACSDTTVNNIYGLVASALTTFITVVLIIYTYLKILKECYSGSKQTRQKAIITCTPHLASLLNYTFGVCFEIVQSRLNMDHVPNMMRIFLSLYFLTCQPLFNPVMYGLNLSKIRQIWKRTFSIQRR
ncbi:hypothetical protein GOODEAATRI_028195 [Goodea atripinnis]|uniref:Olfactory receptor n=1 Tax=Goodea atripinnis TaxID=208336 RepID=A0ABV0PSD4_9TELE